MCCLSLYDDANSTEIRIRIRTCSDGVLIWKNDSHDFGENKNWHKARNMQGK